jgi:hypothetical protein
VGRPLGLGAGGSIQGGEAGQLQVSPDIDFHMDSLIQNVWENQVLTFVSGCRAQRMTALMSRRRRTRRFLRTSLTCASLTALPLTVTYLPHCLSFLGAVRCCAVLRALSSSSDEGGGLGLS